MPMVEDPAEFIDLEEFGDIYIFNNTQVDAIVDDHAADATEHDGILVNRRTMTLAASTIVLPVIGQEVTLDGKTYVVEPPLKNQGGIAEITMVRFVS